MNISDLISVADALLVHYEVSYRRESDIGRGAGSALGASTLGKSKRMAYDRPSRLYIILLDTSIGNSGGAGNTEQNGVVEGKVFTIAEKREALGCLALLASSGAVGFMVSVSSVSGLGFSCDRNAHVNFKWAYIHCPSYVPTDVSAVALSDFGISSGNKSLAGSLGYDNEIEGSNSALLMILKSLTPKHKEVLRTLVTLSSVGNNSATSSSDNKNTAIHWTTFLKNCTESMIVKGDADLQLICRELIEHRLIWRGTDSNGSLVVSLLGKIDLDKLFVAL